MQMRMLVTAVWLYDVTGSGLQLGLLGVVQLAVQLPAILFGGALADQWDRKKLIAVTQSFSFIFIGLMTLLVMFDRLEPWHVYAVTAILGVTSVLGGPARSAITANIVPRSHLMHAVTSNTATFQVGRDCRASDVRGHHRNAWNNRCVCGIRCLRFACLTTAHLHKSQDGTLRKTGFDAPTNMGGSRLRQVASDSTRTVHNGYRRHYSELLPPDIAADRGQNVQVGRWGCRNNDSREFAWWSSGHVRGPVHGEVPGQGHDSLIRHVSLWHIADSVRI